MSSFPVTGAPPDTRYAHHNISEGPHQSISAGGGVVLPAHLGMLPMAGALACRNWEEAAAAAGCAFPDPSSVGGGDHHASSMVEITGRNYDKATMVAQQDNNNDGNSGTVVQRKKRQQCAAACIPCAKSKSACDNNRPCKRCMRQNKGKLCFDKVRFFPTWIVFGISARDCV
jgi:hypothetical protein